MFCIYRTYSDFLIIIKRKRQKRFPTTSFISSSLPMINPILSTLNQFHPHQPEFHQAVTEVMDSLDDFLTTHPEYGQPGLLERLIEPERIVIFRVSRVDDQGVTQTNRGYRVQYNSAIGPYKGGLRFHPTVNLSILKFLGFEQIFKNALTGLPMGGGKGWADFDPKGKSDAAVMRFCQSFMIELSRHIGADTDVPAGDIGVGGREIGYMFGQYKRLRNERTGVLTGKGLQYGGSLIRTEATGYGLVYFVREMLSLSGQTLAGKKVLVSGSGNVAQYAIEKAMQLWSMVLTASDSDGTVFVADGFTPEMLESLKDLKNNQRWRISRLAELFPWQIVYHAGVTPRQFAADITLPCATQNELGLDDAKNLVSNRVMLVAEWANMPTTLEATTYLINQWVLFAPGKAANAWGVATSGLEMSQNSLRLSWTREEVDAKLQDIMRSIHDTCVRRGTQADGSIHYVKGANIGWFVKVADAMIAQGVV